MNKRKNKMNLKKSLILGLASLIGILTFSTSVNAATTHLSGNYSGTTDETITLTQDGTYTFHVYGAQGGSYGNYTGGKGGYVSFSKDMKAGDTIRVVTGAGAGTGTLTNGGGYSAIYINGTLAGVAGGGGGATKGANGGDGGTTDSGNNNTNLEGTSSTAVNTAGGGAGYKGGTTGHYHAHVGSTSTQGACYNTPVYHEHKGSSIDGGGCYIIPNYYYSYLATSYCYHQSLGHAEVDDRDFYRCYDCNNIWWDSRPGPLAQGTYTAYANGYTLPDNATLISTTYEVGCGKTAGSTVDSYKLTCTETAESIQSKGGSNYINESLVKSLANQGGNNADVAKVTIGYTVVLDLDTNKPDVTNNEPILSQTTISVFCDTIKTELPEPTLIGYEFLGWTVDKNPGDNPQYVEMNTFIDSTKISALYAQWSPKTINVVLDKNNEYAEDIETTTLSHVYDTAYDLPIPTSKYSNFDGWALDINGTQKIINKTTLVQRTDDLTETTVYAQWLPAKITLNFDATTNGGTLVGNASKEIFNESEVGTLPKATKAKHNFIGWFTAPTGGDPVTEGTLALFDKSQASYKLYAQFEPKVTDWPFQYTGSVQTWTAPSSGYYLFEAYGAQGGSVNNKYVGGKGGYTSGIKFLNAGDTIYVYVGGQGKSFNGGGTGAVTNGGGGTDFRFKGTEPTNRFLVAGGGGGATGSKVGGAGGASGSGNTGVPVNGASNTGTGGAGGGGGYIGGNYGYLQKHYHASSGCGYHSHSGSCYTKSYYTCSGGFSHTSTVYPGFPNGIYYCNACGHGLSAPCPHQRSKKSKTCGKSEGWTCGKSDGQVIGDVASVGGSNYVESNLYCSSSQGNVRSGDGYAKITAMYTVVLDTSKPSKTNGYTANATNIPFIDNADTLLNETSLPYASPNYSRFESTGQANKTTYGLMFVRDLYRHDAYEKLPIPTLKGWKFLGWYTEPQLSAGEKILDTSTVNIENSLKMLDNHILYAHWEPEVYYIKYYMNNTNKNVYNDTYTDPVAHFDTSLTGAYKTANGNYTYNATEDCYIQTVKYDHDIKVLPNYYAKTGYYFKNWTNKADTNLTGLTGIKETGTGTGKQTGTGYYESDILTPVKNGETFQANKGNFNYITNEKALSLGTATQPVWAYGNQTVVLYATWEPIKYQLRFNGTDNWNDSSAFSVGQYTNQDSYLQKVTNAAGAQDTKIRYDQIFTLDANQFTRNAPHSITSEDGLSVVLKAGYGHLGWGFGQNTMAYDTNTSYKLLSMNTEHDPEQALTEDADTNGRDYKEAQANVKNVISPAGIQKITKYISDWSNARTDSNRKDKTDIENNVIDSNLHSLWRREADTPPESDHENCLGQGCACPDDGNGHCACTTPGVCPDTDNDGVCDCHDSSVDTPITPPDDNCYGDNCPCPNDGNGHCVCTTPGVCPDTNANGVCDCHESSVGPTPPDSPTPPPPPDTPDDPNDPGYGITLTFDLNGGYINKNNRLYKEPIVLKQELFNDYYYEFDIIGNTNKDHLNNTAVIDAYGAYSNTSTPKKNYNSATGINIVYGNGDNNGGLYRLSGWSTNKGAVYPDYRVTIDGIKNINLDTFDAAKNNNTIKICNDTVLYAVWEPVLQMNVELTNTNTSAKAKTGTLTAATQESMRSSGIPTLAVKPGQEVKYLIYLRGENKAAVGNKYIPMDIKIEFDSLMTGIYDSQYKDLHDNLNQIGADDKDDPNETMLLSTSNLNRKFIKQSDKSIIRKFNFPLYVGTERAADLGYDSFKESGYSIDIIASRPSNFYKGDEVVTAKLLLDTSKSSSGGSGPSPGPSPGPTPGPNPPYDGPIPRPTVGEFRTNIRIK